MAFARHRFGKKDEFKFSSREEAVAAFKRHQLLCAECERKRQRKGAGSYCATARRLREAFLAFDKR